VAEVAAATLYYLADDGEGADARRKSIAEAGGVAALVAAAQRPELRLAGLAAAALRNLVEGGGEGANARRADIIAAGGGAALLPDAPRA